MGILGICSLALLFRPLPAGAQSTEVILTSDRQLTDLTDPDKKIDISLGFNPARAESARNLRRGEKRGCKELIVAFDEFFRQYRKDTGSEN